MKIKLILNLLLTLLPYFDRQDSLFYTTKLGLSFYSYSAFVRTRRCFNTAVCWQNNKSVIDMLSQGVQFVRRRNRNHRCLYTTTRPPLPPNHSPQLYKPCTNLTTSLLSLRRKHKVSQNKVDFDKWELQAGLLLPWCGVQFLLNKKNYETAPK